MENDDNSINIENETNIDETYSNSGIDLNKIEEFSVFLKTLNSFYYYAITHLTTLKKRSEDFELLTKGNELQLKTLKLPIYQKFQQTKICIKVNFEFLKLLVADAEGVFFDPEELEYLKLAINQQNNLTYPTQLDMDKVNSTLKQLVRDWSLVGKKEREGAYLPICNSLLKEYGHIEKSERFNIKVLVPGAGLGRLVYDIAKLGFSSEGNEFTYPMLITSYYILNKCTQANQFKIYPYCTNYSNNWSGKDQFLPVEIPDELPSIGEGNNINFSMSAGDFEEVYGLESNHKENWDCVATCFFIDTAKNVLNYIDIIHNLLKPNSIWVNLGPLLYHFENNETDHSIELTWEELKLYILAKGFIIEEEESIICQYTANNNSMLQYNYNCVKFVARKPNN